ncbi:hypothetical protein DPEC_G00152950 [Dallia pectoralis]|uniref:Uncharacterized protein n=1 Tax=Dallia pectoralis TaxID=75939 RepID=A0ACC2GK38_DALPE|nr:hypothetical protein DPEC_G00152950 [Dallia pectoralis]
MRESGLDDEVKDDDFMRLFNQNWGSVSFVGDDVGTTCLRNGKLISRVEPVVTRACLPISGVRKSPAFRRLHASSACLSAAPLPLCGRCDLKSLFGLLTRRPGGSSGTHSGDTANKQEQAGETVAVAFILRHNEVFLHLSANAEDPGIHLLCSMVQLVGPSRRAKPNGTWLLCKKGERVPMRVPRLLERSSTKSMRFLWNIFSKGSHMLQCLCGKSLKKTKNPTGECETE